MQPYNNKAVCTGLAASPDPAQALQQGGSVTDPARFGEQEASAVSNCRRQTHLSFLKYPGLENHELFKIIS